jgi:hypothetical protein
MDEIFGDTSVGSPSPEVEKKLIERQIELWKNTLADARISYGTAKAIKDEQMEKTAIETGKKAFAAIKYLEGELAKVKDGS